MIGNSRPPLPHAVTLDAPTNKKHHDRPPLRRSIRLEEEDAFADQRRKAFLLARRQISFDEGDASGDDTDLECECQRSSVERSQDTEEEPSPPTPPPPTARPPPRALSQGIFERKMPRMYKFGLMDKCKRASSSALYDRPDGADQSPTETFYNATGSTRLSSQELFEKFCSEDFISLYGRQDTRRRTPHSKSTGSSGSDVRHEKICCRRGSPGGSQPALGMRRHLFRTTRSDRSTDSEDQPSPSQRRGIPTPRSLPIDYETEMGKEHYSKSAPLLSPDHFDGRFTFDISEHSEVTSCRDETPSDATETRNLTLYEEPHSDRTSICELLDGGLLSNRSSLRRQANSVTGAFDLSTLDFRAIDDDSPRSSRKSSDQRSLDETLKQNSDNKSWASDSVFATPERRPKEFSPSSSETRQCYTKQSDSFNGDNVTEEEPNSIIERNEYAMALRLGRIEIDESVCVGTEIKSNVCPTKLSRPSMHKLEPLETVVRRQRRGASEPRRPARCVPL